MYTWYNYEDTENGVSYNVSLSKTEGFLDTIFCLLVAKDGERLYIS